MATTITNNDRRRVFRIANALHYSQGMSRAAALRKAWRVVKLRKAMQAEPTEFTFLKKSGERRPAVGTLNPTLYNYTPKGSSRKQNPLQVKYYDLQRGAFRSFNAANLI